MNKEITVNEANSLLSDLEKDISKLLSNYSIVTGLPIDRIDLDVFSDGVGSSYHVDILVDFPSKEDS